MSKNNELQNYIYNIIQIMLKEWRETFVSVTYGGEAIFFFYALRYILQFFKISDHVWLL